MTSDDAAPPAVALCGVDFGWGSAGKISAIAAALASSFECDLVVLGTRLGGPVLADLPVSAWYGHPTSSAIELRSLFQKHNVVAGIVVLDPHAADLFEASGCPTVYVDSLPFLWTDADPIPREVTYYCAQRYFDASDTPAGVLTTVRNLKWTNPIVATPADVPVRRVPGRAVVNLGGLHSPVYPHGNPRYCELIFKPLLQSLVEAGYGEVHVCGNLKAGDLAGAGAASSIVADVGPRPHAEFLNLLTTTDVLVTSPGLTTLLEAARTSTPTVCLPPQNLSQVYNGDWFVKATGEEALRVPWPTDVLDLSLIESVRHQGEEAALAVMTVELADADVAAAHPALHERIAEALELARLPRGWNSMAAEASDGAAEVAALVRALIAKQAATPDHNRCRA